MKVPPEWHHGGCFARQWSLQDVSCDSLRLGARCATIADILRAKRPRQRGWRWELPSGRGKHAIEIEIEVPTCRVVGETGPNIFPALSDQFKFILTCESP